MASSARRGIHGKAGVRFKAPWTPSKRKSLLRNQLTDLIIYEQLLLTRHDAKAVKAAFDRLVTYAKIGDLHHRRLASRKIRENVFTTTGGIKVNALQKLFSDFGSRFKDRNGGYLSTFNAPNRRGDNAEMLVVKVLEN